MILFLESSALVKRYIGEPGTQSVLGLIDSAEYSVASRLTWLEVTSAVARRAREGAISDPGEVMRALDDDFASLIEIMEVKWEVIAVARQLALRHTLRAADALQLATAKEAVRQHGSGIRFLCADQRLLAAASAEGVESIDPTA